jgi:hypothetical protein
MSGSGSWPNLPRSTTADQPRSGGPGGVAFHDEMLELEETKRQNDQLQKRLDDLQHQLQLIQSQLPQMTSAPIGETLPSNAPRRGIPSRDFRMPVLPDNFDVQSRMIDQFHGSKGKPGA